MLNKFFTHICIFLHLFVGSSGNQNKFGGGRFKRQIPNDLSNSNGEEKTYELEISFPTKDTDEVINDEGRRQKLTELFERLLFENEQLDVSSQLPNTEIDSDSIGVSQAFSCDEGNVVRENQCGKLIRDILFCLCDFGRSVKNTHFLH